MRRRACPLAIGLFLSLGAGPATAEPAAGETVETAALEQRPVVRRGQGDERPRFLWGMGEWPHPALEAERRMIGFRFEFQLGEKRSRDPRVR
jgi:hypothetical protein